MSKLVCLIKKIKPNGALSGRVSHNFRTKDDIPNVDYTRTNQNYNYSVAPPEELHAYIQSVLDAMNKDIRKNKVKGVRAIKKNANKVFEMVITSDGEFFEENDYQKFFEDAEEYIKTVFPDSQYSPSILSCNYHLDEKTPHAHYIIMPMYQERINYNYFFPNPESLSAMQQTFFNHMKYNKGYNLEDRVTKAESKEKHQDSVTWSKKVQKAKTIVDALDPKHQKDLAVQAIILKEENAKLKKSRHEIFENNEELEDTLFNTKIELETVATKYNKAKEISGLSDLQIDDAIFDDLPNFENEFNKDFDIEL